MIVISEHNIMFNKIATKLKNLEEKFETFKKKNGESAIVIIKADKSITHGLVVSVMDIAKRVGFNRLGIATEPK